MTLIIDRNRQFENTGNGLESGVWLFEQFVMMENVMFEAKVSYSVANNSETIRGGGPGGIDLYFASYDVEDAEVFDIIICDDEGNQLTPSDEDLAAMKAAVLEAFANVHDAVIEFENECAVDRLHR